MLVVTEGKTGLVTVARKVGVGSLLGTCQVNAKNPAQ